MERDGGTKWRAPGGEGEAFFLRTFKNFCTKWLQSVVPLLLLLPSLSQHTRKSSVEVLLAKLISLAPTDGRTDRGPQRPPGGDTKVRGEVRPLSLSQSSSSALSTSAGANGLSESVSSWTILSSSSCVCVYYRAAGARRRTLLNFNVTFA